MVKTLILHNIRSAHNVGSLLRTADAAGVEMVYLTGYTPAPVDRFGRNRKDIAKTALGAENTLSWKYTRDIKRPLKWVRAAGMEIVALEQTPDARDYWAFQSRGSLALVVGNEVRGLSRGTLGKCDAVIEIPMHGGKESLNVAVAAGIALFTLRHD